MLLGSGSCNQYVSWAVTSVLSGDQVNPYVRNVLHWVAIFTRGSLLCNSDGITFFPRVHECQKYFMLGGFRHVLENQSLRNKLS